MAQYRDRLPQLDADLFLTDGGIETTLIFDDGLDLPDFAAFTLLADEAGRSALVRFFDRYADIARRDECWRRRPGGPTRTGPLGRAIRPPTSTPRIAMRSTW